MTATAAGRRAHAAQKQPKAPRIPKRRLPNGRGEGPTRRRRALWPLLIAVTVIGIVFIGVYPTRTWLAQRGQLNDANHQLSVLEQQNDALSAQVTALNTDSEIERIAREKFNLVRPGEESYAINPAPPPPLAVPGTWPFGALASELATPG